MMDNTNNSYMWKRFVIYGLLGICAEVFWNGFGAMIKGDILLRGTTCIWMFPIYGLAIFLEPVHYRIKHLPLMVRGGIYMVLIFSVELISGLLLKFVLGSCPWNYVSKGRSILGIITIDYAIVWVIVGLAFERIHDTIILIESGVKLNTK